MSDKPAATTRVEWFGRLEVHQPVKPSPPTHPTKDASE